MKIPVKKKKHFWIVTSPFFSMKVPIFKVHVGKMQLICPAAQLHFFFQFFFVVSVILNNITSIAFDERWKAKIN